VLYEAFFVLLVYPSGGCPRAFYTTTEIMASDEDSVAMVGQPLKVRPDQKKYLRHVKKRDGNASHFIRVALDIHIERDKEKERQKKQA